MEKVYGDLIITSEQGTTVLQTSKCCHCSYQWVIIPGSKRKRGYCTMCKEITCGKESCNICIPFQMKVDFYDGGNGMLASHIRKSKENAQKVEFIKDKFGNFL